MHLLSTTRIKEQGDACRIANIHAGMQASRVCWLTPEIPNKRMTTLKQGELETAVQDYISKYGIEALRACIAAHNDGNTPTPIILNKPGEQP